MYISFILNTFTSDLLLRADYFRTYDTNYIKFIEMICDMLFCVPPFDPTYFDSFFLVFAQRMANVIERKC